MTLLAIGNPWKEHVGSHLTRCGIGVAALASKHFVGKVAKTSVDEPASRNGGTDDFRQVATTKGQRVTVAALFCTQGRFEIGHQFAARRSMFQNLRVDNFWSV